MPTKLREIITIRYSTQVVDRASSDMVLGKGKAAQGADASVLSEEHKGVGVLVTGPASYVTVRADYLDGTGFAVLCRKGRVLREVAGQLTGEAAGDVTAAADAAGVTVPAIVSDTLEVMRHSPRMFTTDLLNGLVNLDEDEYGDFNAEALAAALEAHAASSGPASRSRSAAATGPGTSGATSKPPSPPRSSSAPAGRGASPTPAPPHHPARRRFGSIRHRPRVAGPLYPGQGGGKGP